jgi:hypothetical protein
MAVAGREDPIVCFAVGAGAGQVRPVLLNAVSVVNSLISSGSCPDLDGLFGIGISAVLCRWPHATRRKRYERRAFVSIDRLRGGRRVGVQIVAERFAGQALLERGLQHSVSQPVRGLLARPGVWNGGKYGFRGGQAGRQAGRANRVVDGVDGSVELWGWLG